MLGLWCHSWCSVYCVHNSDVTSLTQLLVVKALVSLSLMATAAWKWRISADLWRSLGLGLDGSPAPVGWSAVAFATVVFRLLSPSFNPACCLLKCPCARHWSPNQFPFKVPCFYIYTFFNLLCNLVVESFGQTVFYFLFLAKNNEYAR